MDRRAREVFHLSSNQHTGAFSIAASSCQQPNTKDAQNEKHGSALEPSAPIELVFSGKLSSALDGKTDATSRDERLTKILQAGVNAGGFRSDLNFDLAADAAAKLATIAAMGAS